ncbi:hemin uptake protein HemP [Enterovirga sp. CN4-39]|uniref:hemin uptake protein HemP n=1 Tax=Enterovirga sp. CN4-39 TaxID=3400910 RepID=UPI003C109C2D
MSRDPELQSSSPERPRPQHGEPRAVQASQLLGGAREIIILHRGERYRLRLTQHDKLILTK